MNIFALSSGRLKNFVGTLTTNTTGLEFVSTTSTSTVIRVASVLFSNATTQQLATATLNMISDGVTHTLASGVDVDPAQAPLGLIGRTSPLYLTGNQSLRGFASSTNITAVVAYEELQ